MSGKATNPMLRLLVIAAALLASCSHEPSGAVGIQRISVSSSAINSIGSDGSTQTLQIEVSGGEIYDYRNVPANVHRAMMAAPSKGKFFHRSVKNQYRARQI